MNDNVHQLPPPDVPQRNGNRIEARVSVLESELRHLATKRDIERLRSWILGGVLLGMMAAAGLAVGIARLFQGSSG